MDLQRVKASADAYNAMPEQNQAISSVKMEISLQSLRAELPTLSDDQLAAVAWAVAGVMAAIRTAHVFELSDLINDTAVGYTLATCKLHGLIDQ